MLLHNGMASVKFVASQARSIYQYMPQCNLLPTLYYYIDIVVYWRYIIYYTIVIAQWDGFCQTVSLLAFDIYMNSLPVLADYREF